MTSVKLFCSRAMSSSWRRRERSLASMTMARLSTTPAMRRKKIKRTKLDKEAPVGTARGWKDYRRKVAAGEGSARGDGGAGAVEEAQAAAPEFLHGADGRGDDDGLVA